jgi:phosphatidate cytidylyltransferase
MACDWGLDMLGHRLWMGALLILLAAGVLLYDREPSFPFLLALILVLGVASVYELHLLLPGGFRPPFWLCLTGTLCMLLANWSTHLPWGFKGSADSGRIVLTILAIVVLAAFVAEMLAFREPGGSVPRIAVTCWIVLYLGFLPGFLVQLRWSPNGIAAVALAIFVPKFCDIGAYVTGRLVGRHPMSPLLSPRKTLEGLAGGLTLAMLAALALNRLAGAGLGDAAALGFGLTVGLAGVLGDLAESLIKRDCWKKDASHIMPGFGGVLDVVDSILFAAPVAWWWLG